MIPALDVRGLLPPGRYTATFEGLGAWFADNNLAGGRAELLAALREVCRERLQPFAAYPLYVAGSVLSRKREPDDIDITVDLMRAPEAMRAEAQEFFALHHGPLLHAHRVAFYPTTRRFTGDWLYLFECVEPWKADRDLGADRDWRWERRGVVALRDWGATA